MLSKLEVCPIAHQSATVSSTYTVGLAVFLNVASCSYTSSAGGGASSSSSSSSTTKCYMGSYPYSEIPCDQMEVQSNKDKDEQGV